jgi:hypothetical protein
MSCPVNPPVAEMRASLPADYVYRGAEIGVYKGNHAESLLKGFPILASGALWLVDCWGKFTPETEALHGGGYMYAVHSTEDWEAIYQEVKIRFAPHPNVHIIREASVEAAKLVETQLIGNPLDFVYIDAGHTFEAVTGDIRAWLPLVRLGGWVMGDDYNRSSVKQGVDEFTTSCGYMLVTHSEMPPYVRDDTQWWFIKTHEVGE